MKTRSASLVLITTGSILTLSALAKLASALGTAKVLGMSDPLLGISYRYLLTGVAGLEILTACLCFLRKSSRLAIISVAWLCTSFLFYRVGLWWIGWKQPCKCMGTITDALHIDAQTADYIAVVLLGYMLIGSYGILLVEYRRSRLKTEESAEAIAAERVF